MLAFVTLFTISFQSYVFSQENVQHLQFMDIPIDGKIDEFAKRLQNKGFVVKEKTEHGIQMSGSFAGQSDVELYVLTTKKTHVVFKVVVYFPKQLSWNGIERDYEYYKDLFTKKYGIPEAYEFFKSPYYKGDGYEMSAIKLEKCVYLSFFKLQYGSVVLEISKYQQLRIAYEDKENVSLAEKEKNESIMSDI